MSTTPAPEPSPDAHSTARPGHAPPASPAGGPSGAPPGAPPAPAAPPSDPAADAIANAARLACPALRWRCSPERLGFRTTREVEPIAGIQGQATAAEAIRFGVATDAPGHHLFVRGEPGCGRMTLVRQLLRDHARQAEPARDLRDHLYVHDFTNPAHPRHLCVPAGEGRRFVRELDDLAAYLSTELEPALAAPALERARAAVGSELDRRADAILAPLRAELEGAGLALVGITEGGATALVIAPVIDGEPVPPEVLEQQRAEGTLDETRHAALVEALGRFAPKLDALRPELETARRAAIQRHEALVAEQVRAIVRPVVDRLRRAFTEPEVHRFLGQLEDAVAGGEWPQGEPEQAARMARRFRANLVRDAAEACRIDADGGDADGVGCFPVLIETLPEADVLVGSVEPDLAAGGVVDHLSLRAGALLRADGGVLVLEARDVLAEEGAWRTLVRTLRTQRLDLAAHVGQGSPVARLLRPEPAVIDVKVILVGEPFVHAMLEGKDPDFPQLFKVIADLDGTLARDDHAARLYAGAVAGLAASEDRPHFSADAVAALLEHGSRIAQSPGRVTARLGRINDIAREAGHVAGDQRLDLVERRHVRAAIAAGRRRLDLPAERFRRMVREGMVRIETDGARTGQVNGLATISIGALTYGFPQRITASVGPGESGAINIDREAELSGSIHTKGFYILRGLLLHLLRPANPLAFDAAIAFEQSYGGVDGDSASGAECCCLLSAIADLPLRQDVAMTGAIDQHGNVMAVGSVTEKIEGFHDLCAYRGLTGRQGCIVPRANAGDLMLREDVVAACEDGRFHVWAIDRIEQAVAILTGRPAGDPADPAPYASGTVLATAAERAAAFWDAARS